MSKKEIRVVIEVPDMGAAAAVLTELRCNANMPHDVTPASQACCYIEMRTEFGQLVYTEKVNSEEEENE